METITLDQVVDTAMKLPSAQRDMLLDILRGRQIEARREAIAAAAKESIEAFRAGNLRPQSADGVIGELRQALEEPE